MNGRRNSGRGNEIIPFQGIILAAAFALCSFVGEVQARPTAAHPTDLFGGRTHYKSKRGNVTRNNGSRTGKGVFANGYAANHRGIGAQRSSTPHDRLLVFVLAVYKAARSGDVRENHGRPAEHVVLEFHARV